MSVEPCSRTASYIVATYTGHVPKPNYSALVNVWAVLHASLYKMLVVATPHSCHCCEVKCHCWLCTLLIAQYAIHMHLHLRIGMGLIYASITFGIIGSSWNQVLFQNSWRKPENYTSKKTGRQWGPYNRSAIPWMHSCYKHILLSGTKFTQLHCGFDCYCIQPLRRQVFSWIWAFM